ncbi:MAG: DUF5995 family protein [Candidatus Dormibacteria bacterium]
MTATLERWDTSGDRRALFLRTWSQATDKVLRAVRNRCFNDPQWILHVFEQLADYYFITVEPEGDDLSYVTAPAWHAAHDASAMPSIAETTVIQLGYNAAVSNDLPQAVCDVVIEEWPLTSVRLERRYQDFRIAGDIISSAAAGMEPAVSAWIEDVWPQAMTLLTAADNSWRDAIRGDIEHTALQRAHLISCEIEHRDNLMLLDARGLNCGFPLRHDTSGCRLAAAVPSWGAVAAT